MKLIKNVVIGLFAIIGLVSVLSGFTNSNNTDNEIGRYQITSRWGERGVYRVDTSTGIIVMIPARDLEKVKE